MHFQVVDKVGAPLKAFNGHNDEAIELITRCKEGGRRHLPPNTISKKATDSK